MSQNYFLPPPGHLSTGNWAGVAQDLVNLEFAPQGYTNLLEVEGFLELIEQARIRGMGMLELGYDCFTDTEKPRLQYHYSYHLVLSPTPYPRS